MSKLAYIARPIDFIEPGLSNKVRRLAEQLVSGLQAHGVAAYQPAKAFTVSREAEPASFINEINNTALFASSVVVAIYPDGAKSWGLPAEVALAAVHGIPVVLIHGDNISWAAQYDLVAKVKINMDGNPAGLARIAREVADFAATLAYEDDPYETVADVQNQLSMVQPEFENIDISNAVIGSIKWEDGIGTVSVPRETNMSINVEQHPADMTLNKPLQVRKVRHNEWDLKGNDFYIPTRANHDDAGLDLYVSANVTIQPHSFVDVPTNTAVSLPAGTWGYLTGRSSTLRKKGLLVNPGVIDAGYTGELFSGVWNLSDQTVTLAPGDRIAQLVVLPNLTQTLEPARVEEFGSAGTRGERGFGSSGV